MTSASRRCRSGTAPPWARTWTPSRSRGTARPYKIGDVIGVDITFSESVRVTATPSAAPRLSLVVGTATRHAVWKSGQGPGSTHRFEYTVPGGASSTPTGCASQARSLEAPTGSAIVTDGDRRDRAARPCGRCTTRFAPSTASTPRPSTGSEAAVVAGPVLTLTFDRSARPRHRPERAGGIHGAHRWRGGARGPRHLARRHTTRSPSPHPCARGPNGRDERDPRLRARGNAASRPRGQRRGWVQRAGGDTTGRDQQPATARVTVTGTATVGQTLHASVSDVTDPDGPASTGFTFECCASTTAAR